MVEKRLIAKWSGIGKLFGIQMAFRHSNGEYKMAAYAIEILAKTFIDGYRGVDS